MAESSKVGGQGTGGQGTGRHGAVGQAAGAQRAGRYEGTSFARGIAAGQGPAAGPAFCVPGAPGADQPTPTRPTRGKTTAVRAPVTPRLAMVATAEDLGAGAAMSAFALGAGPGIHVQPDVAALPDWPAHCGPDLRRRMSDHIAYALLAYTALQIFVTMSVLRAGGTPLLPFVALIVLVAAIIPACRRYEMRWSGLAAADMVDPALLPRFRRDLAVLWVLAAGLPFVITGVLAAIGDVAG